jgi:UDP-N-acetylmuramyl pentapeptide synthase
MEKINAGIIAKACSGRIVCGNKDSIAEGVSIDSRTTEPGDAFFALVGLETDGHRYIKNAYDKGSRIFIISNPDYIDEAMDSVFILVDDTLAAFQNLASWYASRFDMKKIAVTAV